MKLRLSRHLNLLLSSSATLRARRSLNAFVLLGLPLALLLGLLAAWQAHLDSKTAFDARLVELTRTTALALDTRFDTYVAAANALAHSSELQAGGMPGALYVRAWELGQSLGGAVSISSTGPGRPQIVNTRRREAMPQQPSQTLDVSASPLRDLEPTISNVFNGTIIEAPLFIISVPAFQDGVARYSVSVAVDPAAMSEFLGAQNMPAGAFAVVTDGAMHIVGRSSDAKIYVGQKMEPWSFVRREGDVTFGRRLDADGQATMLAIRSLDGGWRDWRVVVGIRADQAELLASRPLEWQFVIRVIVFALLALGGGLALLAWRDSNFKHAELDRVLAHVPAIIGINHVWPDGRFRREFISRSAAAVMGRDWEELIRVGSLTPFMAPGDEERLRDNLVLAISVGHATLEYRFQHGDGTWRTARSTASLLERFTDDSAHVVICITDVTEMRGVQERLALLERLEVLGEVASGIAHEVSQPLAAISMAAENGKRALSRATPMVQAAMEKFNRIGEQAHRISAVIDHIRAFARNNNEAAEALDIALVLHEVLLVVELRLESAGIELEIDVPQGLPLISGASLALEQVLVNIIVNACDAYAEKPEQPVRLIHISARPVPGMLRVCIADHAGGIAEPLIKRIFDPFFSTKTIGKGTGLGLSISMASVTDMGGKLNVRNENDGAVFEIVLPVAAVQGHVSAMPL